MGWLTGVSTALTVIAFTAQPAMAAPVAIGSGMYHSCAVLGDGTAKCWGRNSAGQLGDATKTNRSRPVSVSGLAGAVSIAGGEAHTCALLDDGGVSCWGANRWGQLGDGTRLTRTSPVDVEGVDDATAIAVGGTHSCELESDSTVRCWGSNTAGQLGTGNRTPASQATEVPGLSSVKAIAAGRSHTCALIDDGTISCWGWNASGQLGDGSWRNRLTPVQVTGITSATALAANSNESCASIDNDTMACWGDGGRGQLGDGCPSRSMFVTVKPSDPCKGRSNLPKTVQTGGRSTYDLRWANVPIVGGHHACSLSTEYGSASCWGWNLFGQLAILFYTSPFDGTKASRSVAVGVMENPDSRSRRWMTGIKAMTAGESHTCALLDLDRVLCWGENAFGQLGAGQPGWGTKSLQPTPLTVSGLS